MAEPPQSEPTASERPEIPGPPPGAEVDSDSAAKKERDFVGGKSEPPPDWNEIAKTNQIRRDEWMRHAFFGIATVLIVCIGLLLLAGIIIWAIHIMGPHCWRWLEPAELEKIQVLIFSGAVSSLATMIGKRIINRTD